MATLAINGGHPIRTKPYMTWPPVLDEEIGAVNRVLREGQMGRITRFGNGGSNETDTFREAWKQQYPGKEFAIPCGSCCDALELALRNAVEVMVMAIAQQDMKRWYGFDGPTLPWAVNEADEADACSQECSSNDWPCTRCKEIPL